MKNNGFDKVVNAWREASCNLKIKVVAPFFIDTNVGKIEYPILVENFGRMNGTIVLDINEMNRFSELEKFDFYLSAINPISYSNYSREKFIDTLEDWGYFGDKNAKPSWFRGKYYTYKKNKI